jgi:hypothetical protein
MILVSPHITNATVQVSDLFNCQATGPDNPDFCVQSGLNHAAERAVFHQTNGFTVI